MPTWGVGDMAQLIGVLACMLAAFVVAAAGLAALAVGMTYGAGTGCVVACVECLVFAWMCVILILKAKSISDGSA